MKEIPKNPGTWRDYQKKLRKDVRKKYYLKKMPWLVLCGGGSFLVFLVAFYTGPRIFGSFERKLEPPVLKQKQEEERFGTLSRERLQELLLSRPSLFPISRTYVCENQGKKLTLETSINPGLQRFIERLLKRSRTYATAVIALNPQTGQILAIANHDKGGEEKKENLCLKADFPAASLFKIVTAAAVIEAKGFMPGTKLLFRGRKYTLYRSQLAKTTGRYTTKTTLEKAFSYSINPVFGKIGIYDLGRSLLAEYANRFLFNQGIPFDLPMEASQVEIPEDKFSLAEIACGFNKRTLVSPLHVALITAAVANRGIMMAPWLVRDVKDGSGKVIYRASPSRLANPVGEKTARSLMTLMRATTLKGTCRTAFRPLLRKRSFRKIELGAKTGTINDARDQHKYDWVTCYALPKSGSKAVCLAILAIHGKKLGVRASDMAKYILNYHFSS